MSGQRRTRDTELHKDAEQFYEVFSALLRAYQFRDRDGACYHGLSLNGCYALDFIIRSGATTVNDLARELRLNKSSASRIVSSLESEGLVERAVHPDDLRSWILEATKAGRDLNLRIRREIIDRHRDLLAEVTPAARREILALLESLTRSEISRRCATEE